MLSSGEVQVCAAHRATAAGRAAAGAGARVRWVPAACRQVAHAERAAGRRAVLHLAWRRGSQQALPRPQPPPRRSPPSHLGKPARPGAWPGRAGGLGTHACGGSGRRRHPRSGASEHRGPLRLPARRAVSQACSGALALLCLGGGGALARAAGTSRNSSLNKRSAARRLSLRIRSCAQRQGPAAQQRGTVTSGRCLRPSGRARWKLYCLRQRARRCASEACGELWKPLRRGSSFDDWASAPLTSSSARSVCDRLDSECLAASQGSLCWKRL